jgi:hypothetical protein
MNCKLIVVPMLAAFLAGCATSKPLYNPFKVSKQEIRDRVKTVALASLPVDDDVPNGKQAKEVFATSLVSELESLGFKTVPPSEYEQAFNRLRDEVGGFFDPLTGKADNDKYKKVKDLCRRELATKFHADAVLYPSLQSFSVSFYNDFAAWDGTSESVTDANWVERAFAGTHNGSVTALSLCVVLLDTEGNILYTKCGGIQLLAKANSGGFRKVPESKILTDFQRNTNAVSLALKPFHDEEPLRH